MGTHLARNSTSYVSQDGAVEGDSIRCPYHAWRFGPDGKCNEIPYSSGPIPPAAKVRSWPVVERMGAVFVWHDTEGGEPEWDRSEEHTSELQSLMRISYAVFCLKKKKQIKNQ